MVDFTSFAAFTANLRSFAMSWFPNPPLYSLDAGAVDITPGQGLYVSDDQHLPDDVLRIPASSLGSMPMRTPSCIVSATAIIDTPSNMLLQILATWPLPFRPQWTTFLPMRERIGLANSKSCIVGEPTMKVRVAPSAPRMPVE
ncbi:hypothetical protein BC937DRAFT_87964 [Endogone sp. FLAS-F59071]|nr:hypothetical protein BC937DRAFT_87964 [Endogone sp. FLAS-F59071]|eukprot:RUS19130.1 hypothetical protein BC937DRAFT_87964 [Endogone sp. FLAS-F59071]